MRERGRVLWFDGTRRYGFCRRSDQPGTDDVYVCSRALAEAGIAEVQAGDILEYTPKPDSRGRSSRAHDIKLILRNRVSGQI
jgi:cold shock CspA family protein